MILLLSSWLEMHVWNFHFAVFSDHGISFICFSQELHGIFIITLHWNVNPPGLEQSMKPMIGKSIDQSMTVDALLVNRHWLASANRWPIDNHTKAETHRLSSIGVKKSRYPTCSSMCMYVYGFCSTHKCLRFEFVHQLIDNRWNR